VLGTALLVLYALWRVLRALFRRAFSRA
jgi:hypothetical protein